MTPLPPAPWSIIMRSYPCPVCDAQPGDHCITATGNLKRDGVHARRAQTIHRCPRCRSRLPADALPGDFCAYCMAYRTAYGERYAPSARGDS